MHQVARPPNARILIVVGKLDLRKTHAKPRLEKVIAGARNADGPILTELGLTRRIGKDHGNLSEPGTFASFTHKIGRGRIAAIQVAFNLIECCQIDKSTGDV